jgi:hypothetical protein
MSHIIPTSLKPVSLSRSEIVVTWTLQVVSPVPKIYRQQIQVEGQFHVIAVVRKRLVHNSKLAIVKIAIVLEERYDLGIGFDNNVSHGIGEFLISETSDRTKTSSELQ